jgi:phage shock protein A
MVQDFGASREALISLIIAKKTMEREYNANLEELKKWDEKIGLANRSGKIELADEALNRRNFYANTVASIKQHIEQIETKINFAKQKLSSVQDVSSYSAELSITLETFEVDSNLSEFEKMELKIFEMEKENIKFWIRTEEENKIQNVDVVEVSSNTFDAFSSQNSSLNNALT